MGFPQFNNKNNKRKKGQEEKKAAAPKPEEPSETMPTNDVPKPSTDEGTNHEAVCNAEGADANCPDASSSSLPPPLPPARVLKEATLAQPEPSLLPTSDNINNNSATHDRRIMISLTITAISSTLVLLLVAYNLFFRRKQRRQNAVWRKDSKRILTKVEDLVEQLEERDVDVDILEQKVKTLEQQAALQAEDYERQVQELEQEKTQQGELLQNNSNELKGRLQETEARLEQVVAELKRYMEGQQDHECQLLEQKLSATQLVNTIAERDAQMAQLQQVNGSQTERIQELEQKIKADAVKAEKIINDLTSERDDRFAILQHENDAIKTTVMGLLAQTQQKYDADKVLLKKEMRRRDDKIRDLQEELWKSNALLKRLQEQALIQENLSESVRNLISEKETTATTVKERRSSTYEAAETILQGDSDCAELKQLQNLLQPSPTNSTSVSVS